MTPALISPAPLISAEFVDSLTELERYVLASLGPAWLRPTQVFPAGDWRSLGFLGGRGFGKTFAIASQFNDEVEAGRIVAPALMAPTLDRVDEVQITTLIEASRPWFQPERWNDTIRWPNGVVAEVHTPEAPGRTRSSNFDLSWLCEILDWDPSRRGEAFENVTTATRRGRAQYVWDTTSKGLNELILAQLELHGADPIENPVVRGETFDNPLLSAKYLRDLRAKFPDGQPMWEEVLGRAFTKAGAALWNGDAIKTNRRDERPPAPRLTVIAIDPGLSTDPTADPTGFVVGDRGADGHVYVHTNETDHMAPEVWASKACDWCERDAAGVVIETNHLGAHAVFAIRAEARQRNMAVEILAKDRPMPARRPGVIYVREVVAASSKTARGHGPATEGSHNRVHLVGRHPVLERQLTTYVPGAGMKSPNDYDAFNYLVTELAGLGHDSPDRAKRDAQMAATANDAFQKRLIAAARGRRVGL